MYQYVSLIIFLLYRVGVQSFFIFERPNAGTIGPLLDRFKAENVKHVVRVSLNLSKMMMMMMMMMMMTYFLASS